MKKYKLLRDLPLCEAGSICEIRKRDSYDGEAVYKVRDDRSVAIMSPLELQTIGANGKFDEWFEEIEGSKVWKPKYDEEYWYICDDGTIAQCEYCKDEIDEDGIEIGNCFKTKEDAEKAVEKLKALRRLREKGLRFNSFHWDDNDVLEISAKLPWIDQICPEYDQISDDLHRVFGKETE